MAKKKLDEDEILIPEFSPEDQTAKKLPLDIMDGKIPINEFMSIPIDRIVPFSGKQGSDFQTYGETLKQAMIDSIKEHGVIEPLCVRPMEGGKFELLAGESRWVHAKAAGLTRVPCHIMNVDNNEARSIFSLTNLLRRDMSVRDKVNGWWHYYESMRSKNKLSELRESIENENTQLVAAEHGGMLQWRQIMRYVKMHDLIPDWMNRMENEKLSLRVGYRLAFFPEEVQTFLLKFTPTESQIEFLYHIYTGKDSNTTWSLEFAEQYLTPKPAKPKTEFSKIRSRVVKAAEKHLRIEDYERAEEIIEEALKLYYEKSN